jgi:hypothetical protein
MSYVVDGNEAPTMARRVNPARAVLDVGAWRAPIGGAAVVRGPTAGNRPPPPLRGFTTPLTVTAVSQELIPADQDRKFLFITNSDPLGVVFVSIGGQGANLNQGFRLGPNGGSVLLDQNVPTDRVFMIGSIAANNNVSIITG